MVKDCKNKAVGFSMCTRHYMQNRRTGSPVSIRDNRPWTAAEEAVLIKIMNRRLNHRELIDLIPVLNRTRVALASRLARLRSQRAA